MRKLVIILFLCSVSFAQQKAYKNINNFSAGELSPLVSAREDLSKFHSGLTTMENMIPLPQGPARKRPGTKYVAESKNNTKIRLLPFEYSTEQGYILELGNQYMRFFTAASGIVEGDGVEDISALDNVSAHWKLNEVEGTTVADSSANTNNGTATVTISTLTATGKVGTGCFDLADAYTVEVSSHATLSFTDDADDEDFSIVCWAYVTAQKELQNILSKWRDDSTTREWRFSLSEDRKPQLHLADTSVDLSDNRIAQWLLNEDAANTTVLDEDATSHDGTASSNTNTISTTGQINTCFDFGGSESVNISDDDEFTFGDGSDDSVFSISAWIYVTGHTGNQTIVSKWDADDVKEWWFYLDASENLVLRLSDQSASAQIAQTSDDALTTGWHHVIATYDATEAETGIVLYVDGTSKASTGSSINDYVAMENLGTDVVIGAVNAIGAGLDHYWQDKIDNVIIFNKELTAGDRSMLWDEGNGTEVLAAAVINATADAAVDIGWHMFAVTYDATDDGGNNQPEPTAANGITIYVDGVAVDSTATNSALYTSMQEGNEEVRIGSQRNTGDTLNEEYWADKIDEVSLYSDLLTSSEIDSLYSTSIYEITTPYLTADLFEIKYEQSADVLYLTHPDYEPRKLSRLANNVWTLEALSLDTGPFRTENTDYTFTMTPSAVSGTITLTTAGVGNTPFYAGTTAGHEPSGTANTSKSETGALFEIVQPIGTGAYEEKLEDNYTDDQTENTSWLDCGTIAKGVTWYLTTDGTWTGTVEVQRNYTIDATHDASGWETVFTFQSNDDRNASTNAEETVDEADYRVILTASGDNAENCDVYFRISDTDHIGIVEITSITSPSEAIGTVIKTLADTSATHRYSEGSWSNYRGWPRTVTFFEDRLVFGGNASQPDTIWTSVTGDYENFTEGTDDDEALNLTLSSRQVNVIEWMVGKEKLMIGTSGAEWTLAGHADEALTPTSVVAKQHSNFGSADLQAVFANESVLFFQRGAEKMRELAYNWELDSYIAPDMTILAEHITGDGITDVGYQKTPNSILYCVRDDGEMPIFVYDRKELITSWSRFITDGNFESVAVISGDPEDQVWVSVNRTIGGSAVRYIEYFEDREYGSDIADAYFVDSGVTQECTATTTVSGLGHLVGETAVVVLASAAVETGKTVSAAGNITLTTAASTAHAGLPYTVQMKTMPMSMAAQGATILGRVQRINQVIPQYYESGDFYIGRDVSDKELVTVSSIDTSDTDTDDRKTFPPGYDRFGYIFIYQQSPEPLTILSLLAEFGVY